MVIKKYRILSIIIIIFFLLLLPTGSLGAPNDYPCPCSIWSISDTPAIPAQDESLPVELGLQFTTEDPGYITGLRFYKGSGNSGPHYGHLWTANGALLGTATFTNETDTGWQETTFPTPIAIISDTTYVVSYHAPSGHGSLTDHGLLNPIYNEPLTALANGGVFTYGPSGSFPSYSSGNDSNYWVDVVFNTVIPPDFTPPTINTVIPVNNGTNIDIHTNLTALFSEEMLSGSISTATFELRDPDQNLIGATVTYANGSYTATLNPTSRLNPLTTYTATIKGGDFGVVDLVYNHLVSDFTWSFTTAAPDPIHPTVSEVSPQNLVIGVNKYVNVTALFSEEMEPSTINTSNYELRDAQNNIIPATVSYISGSFTAILHPTSLLANSAAYTARIRGGESGVTDMDGNPIDTDYVWSFTTASLPDVGPGGPILIIADYADSLIRNPFGLYYAEILRAEGLNEFAIADISTVSGGTLASYDVVLLGEMSHTLTSNQVTMFTDWVTAGGNLIAMRPDKQLAPLLGLTDALGVLPAIGAYLLVDTTQVPGQGIINTTIQYHGYADLYTLNGATAVATLYSDATTPTLNPAVSVNNVGTGQAAAFTYDLARSIVYTRQGNPAWVGQNRDTSDPGGLRVTAEDMFFGNALGDPQPNYIDFNKISIPQADEQQRLLANLIQYMNLDKKPLPHFWYFPRNEKAVVIMSGDDHTGGNGTLTRFDRYETLSPSGCSADDWECIRGSSFMSLPGTISDVLAAGYNADGFEIGVHIDTGCVDWTPSSLADFYQNQLAVWHAVFPSLPWQLSERTHCVNWTDWVTQAKVQESHGIRLDTNYYYYPPSWVNDRPGMFTGSGMPMRFADVDGTMIDVYQAVTQMTDESSDLGNMYFNPIHITTLLDNALGASGFYGAFLANMHTDVNPHEGSEAIIDAAVSRGVPVVSGKQMVTWLDGRNASSFGSILYSAHSLSFSILTGGGTNGITAMLPTSTQSGFTGIGLITTITRDGVPVTFTKETIKGIEYAFFNGLPGNYIVTYEPDVIPPVISNVISLPSTDGSAQITWTTDKHSHSRIDYGTDPASLGSSISSPTLVTSHALALNGLAIGATYYFRVTSTDFSNNSTTYPPTGNDPLSFAVPDRRMIDTTVADFSAGTLDTNTYITSDGDGDVILLPTVGTEFSGTSLPAGWFIADYPEPGGTAVVSGGLLTLHGTRVGTNATFGPGRSLDFVATFTSGLYRRIGFGVDFGQTPYASFSTDAITGATLQASSNDQGSPVPVTINTTIPGNWLGTPHHYRIEWNTSSIIYYIDGVQVANHTITISSNMRPMAAKYRNLGVDVTVDWLRMSPYLSSGTFTSRIWDVVGTADWGAPDWTADLPAGTSLVMSVRTGNTPIPDGSWTGYTPITYGSSIGRSSRYLQYQAVLSASDSARTPMVRQVAFGYIFHPDTTPPTITNRLPAPGAFTVDQNSNIDILFSEAMDSSTIILTTVTLRNLDTAIDVPAAVSYMGLTATLNPSSSLDPDALYQANVSGSVADLTGNQLGADNSWTFRTTNIGSFTDNTFAEFGGGTTGSGFYVAETTDGEVLLAPVVGDEFSALSFPDDWTVTQYNLPGSGGSASESGGQVTLTGVQLSKNDSYSPGRWLEFVATFHNVAYQAIGFGNDYNYAPWVIFGTDFGGNFEAISDPGSATLLPGYLGAPHRYKIVWNLGSVDYYIDGTLVASHTGTTIGNLRPMPASYGLSGALNVNWLRMGPYATSGDFISRIFTAKTDATWTSLVSTISRPGSTTATVYTRTSTDNVTWSDWAAVNLDNSIVSPHGRYFQYRVNMTTADTGITPVVENVTINYYVTPSAILPIQAGWNLVTLPLTPITPYNAETLLQAINAQSGSCTQIAQWIDAGWQIHYFADEFDRFPISMGNGYFVLCTQPSSFSLSGNRVNSGVTISITTGLNLIGLPYPATGMVAQGLLTAINSQGGNCSLTYRWSNSAWDAYYLNDFLNNYNILPTEGYFVYCSAVSMFTP